MSTELPQGYRVEQDSTGKVLVRSERFDAVFFAQSLRGRKRYQAIVEVVSPGTKLPRLNTQTTGRALVINPDNLQEGLMQAEESADNPEDALNQCILNQVFIADAIKDIRNTPRAFIHWLNCRYGPAGKKVRGELEELAQSALANLVEMKTELINTIAGLQSILKSPQIDWENIFAIIDKSETEDELPKELDSIGINLAYLQGIILLWNIKKEVGLNNLGEMLSLSMKDVDSFNIQEIEKGLDRQIQAAEMQLQRKKLRFLVKTAYEKYDFKYQMQINTGCRHLAISGTAAGESSNWSIVTT